MSFTAKYHGQCHEGDEIVPGDEVEYTLERDLIHVQCYKEALHEILMGRRAAMDKFGPPPVVCDGCFIEKPCECDDQANQILDQLGIAYTHVSGSEER